VAVVPEPDGVRREAESVPLVETRNLSKHYELHGRVLGRLRGDERESGRAVDDVSLRIMRGDTVSLVGESGCGKSTFGRLWSTRATDLGRGAVPGRGLRQGRRREPPAQGADHLQDPFSSLNPRKTVRRAIEEVLAVHRICPKNARRARVDELLERVGLSPALANRRPRQFSGGQRQRIGIARALAVGPEFIVADEPVSALDVSVQAQVLNLLVELQEQLDLTYLFISHNLGVVRHVSRRVVVMYLGKVVEEGPTGELFEKPLHPYTQALMLAVPQLDPDEVVDAPAVEGDLPNRSIPQRLPLPSALPVCDGCAGRSIRRSTASHRSASSPATSTTAKRRPVRGGRRRRSSVAAGARVPLGPVDRDVGAVDPARPGRSTKQITSATSSAVPSRFAGSSSARICRSSPGWIPGKDSQPPPGRAASRG
jgi:oligopeptide/dipeptide ABC transporter ATP-binding protein